MDTLTAQKSSEKERINSSQSGRNLQVATPNGRFGIKRFQPSFKYYNLTTYINIT